MAAPLIVMILLLSGYAFLSGTTEALRVLAHNQASIKEAAVIDMAQAVERYRKGTSVYPSTLATLFVAPGYEYTRFINAPGLSYNTTVGQISDGTWLFHRASIAAIDTLHFDSTAFWNTNACGTGVFSVATDWCGQANQAIWFKSEQRTYYASDVIMGRQRLNDTLDKLLKYWNKHGSFPNAGLSAGGAQKLAMLSGYNGTASNCTGQFIFSTEIPLGCEDVFSQWGGHVMYNYLSDKYIALVVDTPNNYAGGGRQYIIAEMHY